jgi:hypothetical protein
MKGIIIIIIHAKPTHKKLKKIVKLFETIEIINQINILPFTV